MNTNTRRGTTISMPDLRVGMGRAQAVYKRNGTAVPVLNRRGDAIAQLLPADAWNGDLKTVSRVDGDDFRRQRNRFLYGCSWGLTWLVAQRGGDWIAMPPATFPRNLAPSDLGIAAWPSVRDASADGHPRPSSAPAFASLDVVATLREHERLIGWIGAQVDAILSGKTKRRRRRPTTKAAGDPEPSA